MEGSSVVPLDLLVPDLLLGLQHELDEVLDLILGPRSESLVLPQELVLAIAAGARTLFVEEIGDVHLEDRKDLEQSLQADLVLSVFHATQVGLLNVDAMRQVGLGE